MEPHCSLFFCIVQPQMALQSSYVAAMSNQDEVHIAELENSNDDSVVTIEPRLGKYDKGDSLSSVSDAPTVDHFNISVRDIL